ncbi:hypothetical protein PGTUg99_017423 [Puccinia graminis f. sp. tritici]|uniref:Uncharacterized protein n=1 Tax=Puccinia graminis f. sp. tritici TaxID=56615 RepID=A0A5B0N0B1_PUCGR|nr:hypothetical protein PGTUg99_017423 [Puccinia graminis f. sp. tritici]
MKLLNLLLSLTAAAVAAREPNPNTDITFSCGPTYSQPWCTTWDGQQSRTLLEYANRVGGSNSRNANCIGFGSDLNQCCKPFSFHLRSESSLFSPDPQMYTKDVLDHNICLVKGNNPPAA